MGSGSVLLELSTPCLCYEIEKIYIKMFASNSPCFKRADVSELGVFVSGVVAGSPADKAKFVEGLQVNPTQNLSFVSAK